MAAPADTSGSARRSRQEWQLLAVVLALLGLFLLWSRWDEHRDIRAQEEQRLAVQASAIEQNLARQLQSLYASLLHLRREMAAVPAAERPLRASEHMETLRQAMPGLGALHWLDASGRRQASSAGRAAAPGAAPDPDPDPDPVPDRSAAAAFERARQGGDRNALFVSQPERTADGAFALSFGLTLDGAPGAFGGALLATLEPGYFGTVLGSVLYAPDMWTSLVHGRGLVIVQRPIAGATPGVDVSQPETPFSRHLSSGAKASVVTGVSEGMGGLRLMALRTVQPDGLPMDTPLVLAVSRNLDAVFAPWRRESTVVGAFYLLVALAAAAALRVLQRRRLQVAQMAREQQQQQQADGERLALALHGGDLALWDLDVASGVATVNPRWSQMLGWAPGQLKTDTAGWQALLHPDDRAPALAAQQTLLDGRSEAFEATYRMRHRDGHWIWVLDRGRVVQRGADGAAQRIVGTHMDISERVHAEEAVRSSEENLAITLQSIGDGVIATDDQGRVTRLNDAARKLTGWSGLEAIGEPLGTVFRILDAETREPRLDPVARVLAHGQTVALSNGTVLVARDGSEYQIADSAAPIRDAGGAVVGVVLVFSDVSEQYRTVQALRDRERQLSVISDALPGPVSRMDLEGRTLFVNAAFERWFGLPQATVRGRTQRELLGEAGYAEWWPHIERVQAGQTVTFDRLLPTTSGPRRAIVTLVPDLDDRGVVRGHFAVMTDITERQQAEVALRHSEHKSRALIDSLSAGVVVHGPDTELLNANPAACSILGLTLEQMRGLRAIDPAWYFVEEDGTPMPVSRYPVRLAHDSGSGLRNAVVGIVRPDLAEPVWVLCNAVVIHGHDGSLQEIVVTFSDITERKLADEARARSELRLRTASRMARLGSWQLDAASGQVNVAGELAALLDLDGVQPQPLDGLLTLLAADQQARWRQRLQDSLAQGLAFDDEVDAVTANGRALRLRVLCEAVRDAGGRITGLQGAVQDVTESRRAQQSLHLLQACVARLNDVVLVTEAAPLDEPGPRIVFANPAFERLTGWRPDEVLGRSPRFLQGPQTDRAELARIRHALAQGQPVSAEIVNYDRQGRPYWIEMEIVPVQGEGGAGTPVTHLVAVQRDISQRKRDQAQLLAAQTELAATLAAVPDLLFDVDLEGRIYGHHSPRADLLYAPAEELQGRRLSDLLTAEAATVVSAALRQAHEEGFSVGLQYELELPAGAHWFELSVARRAVPAGEAPRFITLARDVTERKQSEADRRALERQLREVQKMESIGTLAGGIAHDFNNILAAILGNVALARGDLPEGHAALTSLGQIQKAGLRARSLVQQILTFSRRQPHALSVLGLRPVLEETLALLRATLPAGVRLTTRLGDEPLPVRADPTQLQQVLMNLCTNAWQALPAGHGRIEVGLEAAAMGEAGHDLALSRLPGRCAHVWVADNGSGMDAATRERIFHPFFTTKPVGQGTGLGLSVVHGIVQGHGGVITVDSQPGVGSTFHVWLPLASTGDTAADADAAQQAGLPPGGGQSVLYVDDDEVMVLMVQRLLQRAGYRVTVCGDAREALALVHAAPARFDIVVTDYNMPLLSGLELAQALQKLLPRLPVVISSGYLADELQEQAHRAGVRALLKKENTLEELPTLLQQVLAAALD
jgi:PAS domain S-box-containing protein